MFPRLLMIILKNGSKNVFQWYKIDLNSFDYEGGNKVYQKSLPPSWSKLLKS